MRGVPLRVAGEAHQSNRDDVGIWLALRNSDYRVRQGPVTVTSGVVPSWNAIKHNEPDDHQTKPRNRQMETNSLISGCVASSIKMQMCSAIRKERKVCVLKQGKKCYLMVY